MRPFFSGTAILHSVPKCVVSNGGMECMLHDDIGIRKALFHISFADFDVFEQVAGLMQIGNIGLTRLDSVGDNWLFIIFRFDQTDSVSAIS